MARSCPDCGHDVEYAEADARILTATCEGCGKALTVVAGIELTPGTGAAAAAAPAAPSPDGPRCEECDTVLIVRSGAAGSLEAECPECETTLTFVRPSETEGDDDERPSAPAPRPAPRGDFRRAPRRDDSNFDRAPARPCRQCGAPLRFSTGPDGGVVGECDACGNRFSLPPRREGGGFRDGPRNRGPPRGRYGGSGGRDGPPRRPYGRPPTRSRPRDDDDDSRRRRRRRDD
jgi:phage FluMu protein Com